MTRFRLVMVIGLLLSSSTLNWAAVGPPQVDDTVHVLIVKEPNVDQQFVDYQLGLLILAWSNSEFINGDAPVIVSIVNPGAALSTLIDFSGSLDSHITAVKTLVSSSVAGNPSMRDSFAADVVIAFVDTLGVGNCGYAPQLNWGPPENEYIPDPLTDNLDLRARDDDFVGGNIGYYVALVAANSPCDNWLNIDVAAHEFGHLFGAGHHDGQAGLQPGLYPNSKALVFDFFMPYLGTRRYRTVMGRYNDPICAQPQNPNGQCTPTRRFSDNYYDDLSRINTNALDTTGVAVANYRVGNPTPGLAELCNDGMDNDGDGSTDSMDPECQSGGSEVGPPPPPPPVCEGHETPTGVYAYLVETCVVTPTNTWTQYRVQWSHQCQSQVSFYQVWIESPPGNPAPFILAQPTSPIIDILVDGGQGRVRIAACNASFQCSPPSPGGPIITDIC